MVKVESGVDNQLKALKSNIKKLTVYFKNEDLDKFLKDLKLILDSEITENAPVYQIDIKNILLKNNITYDEINNFSRLLSPSIRAYRDLILPLKDYFEFPSELLAIFDELKTLILNNEAQDKIAEKYFPAEMNHVGIMPMIRRFVRILPFIRFFKGIQNKQGDLLKNFLLEISPYAVVRDSAVKNQSVLNFALEQKKQQENLKLIKNHLEQINSLIPTIREKISSWRENFETSDDNEKYLANFIFAILADAETFLVNLSNWLKPEKPAYINYAVANKAFPQLLEELSKIPDDVKKWIIDLNNALNFTETEIYRFSELYINTTFIQEHYNEGQKKISLVMSILQHYKSVRANPEAFRDAQYLANLNSFINLSTLRHIEGQIPTILSVPMTD